MLNLDKQEALRRRVMALRPGYRPALDVYTSWMAEHVQHNTTLLDVGCGPGGLVKAHEGKAAQVIGIDRYAAEFHEPAEIKMLLAGEIDRLPFADASFDLVVCSWVLEHLAAPEACFREIARVLKPGGRFLFITPNKHNYVVWLRRLLPNALGRRATKAVYARDEDFINPTHYRANSQNAVDRLAASVGLKREQFAFVSDPTYLAFNELLFRVSLLVERLIDRPFPFMRVHLVGMYRKQRDASH